MNAEKIIQRVKKLGFPELEKLPELKELDGEFLNNVALLPNGEKAKILDDHKTYLAAQIEQEHGEKCWGIAADNQQLAVFRYEEGGAEAELLAWIKI